MVIADDIWLGTGGIDAVPGRAPGSYVLLIGLYEGKVITTGKLGDIRFFPGFYAYVGSAMNGLRARLERHLRSYKRIHWHVDYLLEKASIIDMAVCETEIKTECSIAGTLGEDFDSIPGFGSSDCRCRSHLFYDTDKRRLSDGIRNAINGMAFEKLKT